MIGSSTGRRPGLLGLAVLLAGVALSPSHAQAQQAVITGKVTAQAGGAPLPDARVYVVGTTLGAATNAEGVYTIRGVPTGNVDVRVLRVGYQEQKKSVAVTAGASATLDFVMATAVVQLQEIVTTATGQQRRVEIGNAVATLGDVAKTVETSPVTSIGDLLAAKSPGVVVLPGTMTGTAPQIRIRGVSSLSLSNAPIWVVDGVRFNAGTFAPAGAGGSQISASGLNGLNPDDIEDIEIVKGPSAATLYGTDASNGVIVVTTKKGRAGGARWTWFGEGGVLQDKAHYPDTWAIWGHRPGAAATAAPIRCLLRELPGATCIKDSVTHLNLIQEANYTPIHDGNRQQGGAQVAGGTDQIRYFFSGDLSNETGPIRLPNAEIARFNAQNTAIRDEWMRPEYLQGQTMRANVSASPNSKLDLTFSTGFSKTNQRFAETDNNFNSIFYQSMMSPGFIGAGLGNSGVDSRGQPLYGNNSFTYGDIFQRLAQEDVQRLTGSVQAGYHPFSWMQNDATVGLDLAGRHSYALCRFGECPDFSQWRLGQVSDRHRQDRNFSLKFTSNATWQANNWLNLKTTAGADYTNQENEQSIASGTQLPPGAQSVSAAAVTTGSSNLPSADKTLGYYVQEQGTFRDRLFLTVAVRSDQNSAFGANATSITYPKVSASWIVSDEPFFPHYNWLNQFRLRSAYGKSGVQPRSTDAFITYTTPTVSLNGTDTPGLRAQSLGNPDLKPEQTAELEAGFEARVLGNRVNIDFTYYNKKTHDALLDQAIAPSAAASATTIRKNLASVQNQGVELTITSTVIDNKNFGWDFTVSGSHNVNKLLSLGLDPTGKPLLVNRTGANRDSVGFPLSGWYYKTYTYADSNSDGVITPNEVVVDPTFRYVAQAIPPDIASISNGFDLFNRVLRINTLFDYKGGYKINNGTYSFQCGNNTACAGLSDPNASLDDQAAAIGFTTKNPNNTAWGYLQSGQFWRFRELSATVNLPQSALRYVRASTASLSFGARNLKVWTKYKGSDPEENFGTGDVQSNFASSAPRRVYTVRLNLHY